MTIALLLTPLCALFSQCEIEAVALPDIDQPIEDPEIMYCVDFIIFPDITGHPIGLSIDMDHTWQGDLSIRALGCGETLMVMTRPGSTTPPFERDPASCAEPSLFGSTYDFDGTYLFLDSLNSDPDIDIAISGGSYGLSGDRCNLNTVSSFGQLGLSCGSSDPYTIQICITDHAEGDDGYASNIFPLFENLPICGCTDPDALNYDPDANVGLDVCEYSSCHPDTIAPTIICPGNQAVVVDQPGDSSVYVGLSLAEAEDNCEIASVENNFNSGGANASDYYPLGANEIIFTATDTSGNTASCMTIVEVEPNFSILPLCQNISTWLDENGNSSINAEDLDGGSIGGIGQLTFLVDGSELVYFDCDDSGTVILELEISDESGQTESCSAEVTVLDLLPPDVECANTEVFLDETGTAVLDPEDLDGGSTDNCGIQSVEASTTTFNCDDLGQNEVHLTVTDFSGNTAVCTSFVTVLDTLPPTSECDDSPVVLAVGTNCLVLLEDLSSLVSAEDNCLSEGDFTIAQYPSPGMELTAGDQISVLLTISEANGWSDICEIEVSAINLSEPEWLSELPADENLECGEIAPAPVLLAGDYCDTFEVQPVSDTVITCTGTKIIQRVWSLQQLEYSQTISYNDTEPPVWTSSLPVNIQVSCDNIPDPAILTAEDDCSEVDIAFSESEIPGSNQGEYILVRVWIASDECGNSISHQQFVTVSDQTSPGMACPTSITYDLQGSCELEVPSLKDSVIVWDNCTDTTDIQLTQSPSAGTILSQPTATVFITATDQSGNSNFCSFLLQLQNYNQPPSLVCSNTYPVTPTEPDECVAFAEPVVSWVEGCDDPYVVNSYNNGGENAGDFYPLGETLVLFQLFENGVLQDSCEITVEVVDNQNPDVDCESLVIGQAETEGDSLVWIEIAEAIAFDNCTVDTLFNNFNQNGGNASDYYPVGITTLLFTAVDSSQNEGSCQTTVVVLEFSDQLDTFLLSGEFLTPFGHPVEGVTVQMEGDSSAIDSSHSDGYYEFFVPEFFSFSLTPGLNENWLDGVSTIDLVLIQRTVIGIDSLGSPYLIIAADVNNDGFVSTMDLVLLQRLILGLDSTITGNSSWRFVPADYEFENPLNPLAEDWPETKSYQMLGEDKTEENWIAIKTGDVSGDASGSAGVVPDVIEQFIEPENNNQKKENLQPSKPGKIRKAVSMPVSEW